ncbi:cell division protein FtsN [Paenibacillus tritici]|uniref:Cell division protein FtsN n=1 Tax=Paenibacillus tritici TaxID=1873425 RepID=A0ABX2DQ34_9BACL|nr:TasA family protein [Paenibacillus tritici]NQX46749.1 cell division protein FtsN [Paenibacillus tritici]QUL55381.1 SipW-dependent-type signal peptide-containing protein [Paenibacillus tritici]
MNVKKTLGLGVVSAALGLTLVGGGTFAYFSSTSTTSASFNNGTLSLKSDPSVIVNLSNLKPGDSILRDFKLKNDGTLNIPKVILRTSSLITDAQGDNGSHNFKDDIIVTFLVNKDKKESPLLVISLADLENQSPDLVARGIVGAILGGEKSGIKAGTSDNLTIQFAFKETLQPQNYYQGDTLALTLNFEANQEAGSLK